MRKATDNAKATEATLEPGLRLCGMVVGRTRRVFPAREGKPARVLILLAVTTAGRTETVEHWGELSPGDVPAVGAEVNLAVRVRCYNGRSMAQYRLVWGDDTGQGEAF